MSGSNLNSVFYADSYHPIQAGSIDGTDIVPHDNGVYRAVLCSAAGLYDPFGDPKVTGDAYCTLFVARLSRQTSEGTLRKAMSAYGRVKNIRLVRDIVFGCRIYFWSLKKKQCIMQSCLFYLSRRKKCVIGNFLWCTMRAFCWNFLALKVTGASRGYAFVEFETEREMRHAYMEAHHSFIDDSEVIVDYNRQLLMPGWIPRRLGGGLGGKKESGQLRFGGRERPFRAPLRPIPYDGLERLGIPPPPEGRFLSRFHVPSPPRSGNHMEGEDSPIRHRTFGDREDTPPRRSSGAATHQEDSKLRYRRSEERKEIPTKLKHSGESPHRHRRSVDEDSTRRKGRRSPFSHKLHRDYTERSRRHKKRSPS